ncbi:MAG: TraB/GumN family protein, partial [Pseudomonadota bacterium]
LQTLADLDQYEGDMAAMVAAWKTGDTAFLEDELLDELKAYPELYDVLVAQRSAAWLPVIEALLGDDDDYLIVVGTLHLVGEHGLPELLSQRGYRLQQVEARAETGRIGAGTD